VRRALVLVLALAAAGCGGGTREQGTATLWVTRDRGAQVLYVSNVPAGVTAMQALAGVRTVHTRYGGRFVQSINSRASPLPLVMQDLLKKAQHFEARPLQAAQSALPELGDQPNESVTPP